MYYLVIIQNDNACAIYRYEVYDEALSAYHTELAFRGSDRTQTLCMILKGDGTVPNMDMWKKG